MYHDYTMYGKKKKTEKLLLCDKIALIYLVSAKILVIISYEVLVIYIYIYISQYMMQAQLKNIKAFI